MNTYTVILSYTTLLDGNNAVAIYMDDTEKHFNDIADAEAYRDCLTAEYPSFNVQLYSNEVYPSGGFVSTDWKRAKALSKLTLQEKDILGLTE